VVVRGFTGEKAFGSNPWLRIEAVTSNQTSGDLMHMSGLAGLNSCRSADPTYFADTLPTSPGQSTDATQTEVRLVERSRSQGRPNKLSIPLSSPIPVVGNPPDMFTSGHANVGEDGRRFADWRATADASHGMMRVARSGTEPKPADLRGL
jgi:hypothetical protein